MSEGSASGGSASGKGAPVISNRGTGMSLAQYIRQLRTGANTRQYGEGERGGSGGAGWGPSGPVDSPSARINSIAQLLAEKGDPSLAIAQVLADAQSVGGAIGKNRRNDFLQKGALGKSPAPYAGSKRSGGGTKAGSGFGGKDINNRLKQVQSWASRDAERDAVRDDEMAMERFRASLRNEELKNKISLIRSLIPNTGSRTTDTKTEEQLVTIAGRPEKRSVSSSQTTDNSARILQQILGLI